MCSSSQIDAACHISPHGKTELKSTVIILFYISEGLVLGIACLGVWKLIKLLI